jgi:uncharacterized protein
MKSYSIALTISEERSRERMTNVEIVRASYEASARGDLDGLLAPFDADSSWTEMAGFPYAGTYHGPAEIKDRVFMPMDADWEDFRADVEEYLDAGDAVVTIGRYRATHRESGKPLDVRFAHLWKLRDGRVVSFEQFADTLLTDHATAS